MHRLTFINGIICILNEWNIKIKYAQNTPWCVARMLQKRKEKSLPPMQNIQYQGNIACLTDMLPFVSWCCYSIIFLIYFSFLKFPFSFYVEMDTWNIVNVSHTYQIEYQPTHMHEEEKKRKNYCYMQLENDALCFTKACWMDTYTYIYTHLGRVEIITCCLMIMIYRPKKMSLYFFSNIWMNEWWVYKGHKGQMKWVLCILNSFKE